MGRARAATSGGGAPFIRTVASTGVTVFAGDTVFSLAKGGGGPGFIWIVGGISLSAPEPSTRALSASAGESSSPGSEAVTSSAAATAGGGIGTGGRRPPVGRARLRAAAARTTAPPPSLSVSSSIAAPNHEPRQYSRSCTKSLAVW